MPPQRSSPASRPPRPTGVRPGNAPNPTGGTDRLVYDEDAEREFTAITGADMIKAIQFKNFKALRDTTLPLGHLTLLIGPNGSGKSTALEGLSIRSLGPQDVTAGVRLEGNTAVRITIEWGEPHLGVRSVRELTAPGYRKLRHLDEGTRGSGESSHAPAVQNALASSRVYSLDATVLARPVRLAPKMHLGRNGEGLAGVLDRLRDDEPERWEALNEELGRWLPEFDQILFDTPTEGHRAIKLRTRIGKHAIPAADISQGTLLALAILTLAYLPDPPPIVSLEEPGRGIHPRLLRHVQDAMYRLAYPDSVGETRPPTQVIATTHSPYMLDLFRDHPEEIVIASKVEGNIQFQRLSEMDHIEEILGEDAPLGEIWYTGILGGVPADR